MGCMHVASPGETGGTTEAPDYFLTLGVKVQAQPAFFWIIDFLSGEMRRLSESGSAYYENQ
jgi:hypothetical protein